MRKVYPFLCVNFMLLWGSSVYADNDLSLCNYIETHSTSQCKSKISILGSESNLDKYFIRYEGYHSGNNEQQMYKSDHVHWNNSDKTVSLLTEAKSSNGHPFTSGEIKTKTKFTITKDASNNNISRGAIEVTAQVPYDYGRWPAIWMMPYYDDANPWPSGMELDILEFMQPPFPVTGTIHYGLAGHNIPSGASWNYNNNGDLNYTPAFSIDNEYHKYGLEWNVIENRSTLTWYFDGTPFYQIDMRKQGNQYQAVMRTVVNPGEKNLTCTKWTNRCPSNYGVTLSQAAYESFMNGFNSGYYLIVNMAVGGNGVFPPPNPNAFPDTEMKISEVNRYIIE